MKMLCVRDLGKYKGLGECVACGFPYEEYSKFWRGGCPMCACPSYLTSPVYAPFASWQHILLRRCRLDFAVDWYWWTFKWPKLKKFYISKSAWLHISETTTRVQKLREIGWKI